MRVESYGATRSQQGRSQNDDAFLIKTGDRPFAALADGAGAAERAAKRILALFEKLFNEVTPKQITEADTWTKWVKLLDSSLLGGARSTFVAVAFVGNEAIGTCVGDSPAYLINRDGQCRVRHGRRKQTQARRRPGAAVPHRCLMASMVCAPCRISPFRKQLLLADETCLGGLRFLKHFTGAGH